MPRPPRSSKHLFRKFLEATLGMMLAITLISGFLLYRSVDHTLLISMERRAVFLMSVIRGSIDQSLSHDELQKLTESLASATEIERIVIMDGNERNLIQTSTDRRVINSDDTRLFGALQTSRETETRLEYMDGLEHYYFSAPLETYAENKTSRRYYVGIVMHPRIFLQNMYDPLRVQALYLLAVLTTLTGAIYII